MQLESPPKVNLQIIPDGPAGILATLKTMRQLTRQGKKNPAVRQLALSLVGDLRGKDWIGEVRAVHAWVRDNIRYVRDVFDVETLHPPEYILKIRQGDCDDQSILIASLLESIGHPTRFIAIGFRPNHYAHVMAEAKIGEKWYPLETTEPVEVGWFPRGVKSRMVVYNR